MADDAPNNIPRSAVLARALRETASFLDALGDIPPPEIFTLWSSGIGCQWGGGGGTILTASLYGDGLVTYCGLFPDEAKTLGTCSVSEPTPDLLAAAARVAEAGE